MFEAEAEAKAKAPRPRLRPRTEFWPRGHFGLENLTSLVFTNECMRTCDRNIKLVDLQPVSGTHEKSTCVKKVSVR